MIEIYFILVCFLFALWDIKYRIIPNIVILPLLLIAIALLGNWQWSVVTLAIGCVDRSLCLMYGGDVKLSMLGGALMGVWSLPVYFVSLWFLRVFSGFMACRHKPKNLYPFAPFYLAGLIAVICFKYLYVL